MVVLLVTVRLGVAVVARTGGVRLGGSRRSGIGTARRGVVRHGLAVMVRRGVEGSGMVGRSRCGTARHGLARPGMAVNY